MGVQFAKALGAARVIAAATGAGKAQARALGADVVVDYHKECISTMLKHIIPHIQHHTDTLKVVWFLLIPKT